MVKDCQMKNQLSVEKLSPRAKGGAFWSVSAALLASSFLGAGLGVNVSEAHPGGLAADGCHNDRKNGGRHCHRAPAVRSPQAQPVPQGQGQGLSRSVHYANCAAARAAGATPVRRGDPGYGPHLDRDNDGVGCE